MTISKLMRPAATTLLAILPLVASAQTATDTFDVQITIAAECEIVSTETLDFGSAGVLSGDVDASADLEVACTESTPFDIGLNEGTGAGGTTATRQMTGPGATTIAYQMFQNAGRTTNWGDAVGTDTVTSTGTGTTQSFTVYGRVIAQTTPAPGTYTDTVTVTVTY
ncbi:Csu type fimbrial protein [Paracoccus laeviglucosivorans]|uniref:Spore coat protein U (SCPU) domain-containing protein n=1 Tax=Paracoccus laeviglucosivorans TaxID=1197861 RepID=A0A521B984_9RHOB|nr:spore coat U domain-containing protein [Paracoccus laeviglucosivorans]SMO43668.1 Spore coat protein U (SCPU) domain-containing protein [Paracoccus laeviglucosivorans]